MPQTFKRTFGLLREHRVMSLAAEVAFFGILSIPPLLVGLISTAGLVAFILGPATISSVTSALLAAASRTFSPETTTNVITPTVHQVLERPHIAALSFGYLLAIWSGSRMINALYESVEILSEHHKERGAIERRLRAIKAVFIGFIAAVIGLPLVLVAPRIAAHYLPGFLQVIGWIAVAVVISLGLAWFMKGALPIKVAFGEVWKGTAILVFFWALFSGVLQWWLGRSTKGIYGPLSAPIALLLWLQILAGLFLIASTYLIVSRPRT